MAPYFLAPLFGLPSGAYRLHHVVMHHIEDNAAGWDLSATEGFQRDSLAHFARCVAVRQIALTPGSSVTPLGIAWVRRIVRLSADDGLWKKVFNIEAYGWTAEHPAQRATTQLTSCKHWHKAQYKRPRGASSGIDQHTLPVLLRVCQLPGNRMVAWCV